jgi:hypothetical protein
VGKCKDSLFLSFTQYSFQIFVLGALWEKLGKEECGTEVTINNVFSLKKKKKLHLFFFPSLSCPSLGSQ